MHKSLFYLIIIFIFISCNQNKDVTGKWILAYSIEIVNQEQWKQNHCSFISIDGNVWKSLDCRRPDMGIDSKEMILDFEQKENKFYFNGSKENYLKLISVNKDSMVLQYPDTERDLRLVYRKLLSSGPINWNPKGNNYRFIGNKGEAYWNFFNDSLMIEHGNQSKSFSSKKWWLEKFEGHTFLILNQIDEPQPIMIDSVRNDSLFFSVLDTEINSYKSERIKSYNSISDRLMGTWTQVHTGLIPKSPESLMFQFEEFEVKMDSILAGNRRNPLKTKWILLGDGETILFPVEKSMRMQHWKIKKTKNDTLILDMPDVFSLDKSSVYDEDRIIRTYIRAPK